MKKPFFYRRGSLLLLIICCLASCGKTPAPTTNPVTPLQTLINTDTSLSIFHRLVLEGNDAGLISDDPITVLIPTNSAFRSAGYTDAFIDTLITSVADRMIRYQYFNSRITPDGNAYTAYPSLLGYSVYGMTDAANQIWFNGTPATGGALNVGNVLVYKLSAPLQPAADSLNILLGNDSSLSFLAEVFQRTHLDSVLFSNNYTLLAPVNSAFIAAGYDSLGAIDLADSNTLVELVKFHTLTGTYFTNTFSGLSTIPTLQGSPVTVSGQSGVLQFAGANNPVPATFLSGNQLAGSNLIVHRIDRVLSP